jgi:hypothetical protein
MRCRHCGENIMKFISRDEGEQWWHADPAAGKRTTSLHCHENPYGPVAEPAQ